MIQHVLFSVHKTNLMQSLTFFAWMRQKYEKQLCFIYLQGFRVLVVSMESAIQATREFQGNLDPQVTLVNGATRGFQGFVTFPCAIRPTTSGNITAKDPMSDDTASWERLLLVKHPRVSRKRFTVSLIYWDVCNCMSRCVENSCTGGRNNLISWVKLKWTGHWLMIMEFMIKDGQQASDLLSLLISCWLLYTMDWIAGLNSGV